MFRNFKKETVCYRESSSSLSSSESDAGAAGIFTNDEGRDGNPLFVCNFSCHKFVLCKTYWCSRTFQHLCVWEGSAVGGGGVAKTRQNLSVGMQ